MTLDLDAIVERAERLKARALSGLRGEVPDVLAVAAAKDVLALAEEVRRLEAMLGPGYHVLNVGVDGWAIAHPVPCRLDLLSCEIHAACMALGHPPVGLGRWCVDLVDGELNFSREPAEE